MKKVYAIEVIKDITGEICLSQFEMHPSWAIKTGTKHYATKCVNENVRIHIYKNENTKKESSCEVIIPKNLAQEYFQIIGEAKGKTAERICKYINQEVAYN